MPGGRARVGGGGDPIGQRAPFAVPGLPVARRDALGGGEDLADVGAAVDGVAERAQGLEREGLVGLEDDAHDDLLYRNCMLR